MAHPDLEELLNALIPFAQEMLSKHGEYHPFGASMSVDGEVNAVAADVGEEMPEAQALIELLTRGFREEAAAGKLRAAGICLDMRIVPPGQTEKTDAICVQLEHASGEALQERDAWQIQVRRDIWGCTHARVFCSELSRDARCRDAGFKTLLSYTEGTEAGTRRNTEKDFERRWESKS